MSTTTDVARPGSRPARWVGGTALGLVLWGLAWTQLVPVSEGLVALLGVERTSHLGESVAFFLYEVPKVLLLLALIVFGMGVVRSFFSAERTRALLAGRRAGAGNVLAAALGVVTPFCSCSAVPLFIGFLSAGVPLGVTFSFLVAAPMVNEVALGLLFALLGWRVALTYLVFGLAVAVGAGWVIGRLDLEHGLQPWVRELRADGVAVAPPVGLAWPDRIRAGLEALREIGGRVWYWIVLGIAAGALIHGYAPEALLAPVLGRDAHWSVLGAVIIGIPMYSNAAGIVPVVEALLGKGAAPGTALAFMMSVTALSLPEMIILRQVLTLRLLSVFVAVVAAGILAVGFLFNLLFV